MPGRSGAQRESGCVERGYPWAAPGDALPPHLLLSYEMLFMRNTSLLFPSPQPKRSHQASGEDFQLEQTVRGLFAVNFLVGFFFWFFFYILGTGTAEPVHKTLSHMRHKTEKRSWCPVHSEHLLPDFQILLGPAANSHPGSSRLALGARAGGATRPSAHPSRTAAPPRQPP